MDQIDCPPCPACLIESMRNVGYSMETAIADIIDNSITAEARNIKILHECKSSDPCIAIIDDGHGMTQGELFEAMRPGGIGGPTEARSDRDMGRFGLGLKTASFSQCRKVTVVSRKNGTFAAACWDLDLIGNEWSLLLPSMEELKSISWIDQVPSAQGTMVLWEKMDRVANRSLSDQKVQEHFLDRVEAVRAHLGLVFHRFIEGSPGRPSIKMTINRLPVSPFDPYFRIYQETQPLETETIILRGHNVTVKPYIIPHYSKLKAADKEQLQAQGGAAGTQGFYVYRNLRLLAWGNWFRLRRAKTEASGLARVMIDIPNALDDLWSLDIKKSSVSPPEIVRHELKRIIDRITDRSTRTYTSRGQRLADKRHALWNRNVSNKNVTYRIAKDHPLIESFCETLPQEGKIQFCGILSLLERNIPLEAINNDSMGGRIKPLEPSHEYADEHAALVHLLRHQGIEEEKILEVLTALGMKTDPTTT